PRLRIAPKDGARRQGRSTARRAVDGSQRLPNGRRSSAISMSPGGFIRRSSSCPGDPCADTWLAGSRGIFMRHLVEGCVTQERGESLFLSNPTPFARLEVPARVTRNETNACGAGRWIAVAPKGQAPRVRFIRGHVPHLVKDTGLRREVGARRHVDTVERAEGARSGTI